MDFNLSNLSLNQLISLQHDTLEIPGIASSFINSPIALQRLIKFDNLIPLHYSWSWVGQRYRDRASDLYFRMDGRMIPLFFVTKELIPYLNPQFHPPFLNISPIAPTSQKPMGQLLGITWFSAKTQGPPGFVHGGALATCTDQLLGMCVNQIHLPRDTTNYCRTLTLKVTYKKGTPLNSVLRYFCWVEKSEGRKHWLSCRIIDESDPAADGDDWMSLPYHVQADALFVQPRLTGDQNVETGPNKGESFSKL
jgi:hypothetical protein